MPAARGLHPISLSGKIIFPSDADTKIYTEDPGPTSVACPLLNQELWPEG